MRAIFVKEFGGVENLEVREVAEPRNPKGKEVLIKVYAAGLNRADILQRRGLYPAPKGTPERILGLEFAGEVDLTGEKSMKFNIGDRVFGITSGGAQSEFILSHEDLLIKIPRNLNFVEAASIAEAFITAYDALFTLAQLRKKETLLIHAIGSGVGIAALQLAKLAGAKVIGTSRSAEKLEKCRDLGLDVAITAIETDFTKIVRKEGGADVILDLVGASYFQRNLESLNTKGRMILVGLTGGSKTEFQMSLALSKRLKIIGTVLRTRSLKEKAQAIRKFLPFLSFFETGELKPVVDRVFKMNEVQLAHRYIEENRNFGKVVLEICTNSNM